mgnify:CR=1 FL=1
MSRHDTIGTHRTTISTDAEGMTHVTYHQTAVVSFDARTITLRTGGWRSNTTKLRMNQTANQHGLGYGVWQKNYAWFVEYAGRVYEWTGDVLTLDRTTGAPCGGQFIRRESMERKEAATV